jgi:hypothetical protein
VRLITVSASYGAGGSVVAPALAGRLGLPFLQRVTTSEGHLAQPGPCDEQLTAEEVKATPVHRLLAHFTQAMPAGAHPVARRPPTTRTSTCAATAKPGSTACSPPPAAA